MINKEKIILDSISYLENKGLISYDVFDALNSKLINNELYYLREELSPLL